MDYRNTDISPSATLLEALKKMDTVGKKLLIIQNENKFIGLISIGDIQRSIIKNVSLDEKVINIIRKNIKIGKENDEIQKIKQMMFDFRMEFLPIVNNNNDIIKIYFWEDVFESNKPKSNSKFNTPVVIMAGGYGKRLKPLTNVLPKPLMPINEKTMLEEIFDRFYAYGCDYFFISLNYKADLIKYYIQTLNLPYKFEFIKENEPLGTAGSLSLLKNKINTTFFVTNCDILIDDDYSEILNYHKENKNDITLVAALRHVYLPYGAIETNETGNLLSLTEKPELTFKVNSGMYILEPNLLDNIPDNKFFHITDLIEKVKNNGKVGVFPISERSWVDYGDKEILLKHLKTI
jgi:dTDP-glucose pyrophosphorylase